MPEMIKYKLSESADIEKIKELLLNSALPVADIDDSKIKFVVAVNEKDDLIGCIGIETYDTDGLLRSFAVDSNYRSIGVGQELLNRLFSLSRQYGINDLHLLTTTAEKYFSRIGFSTLSRADAPASIRATVEFSTLCSSTSAYMVIRNIQKEELCFHKDTRVIMPDKESGSSYWSVNGENMQFTYFEVQADSVFETHKHESEQITHVLEGELLFEIEKKTYRLRSGDTIIVPSGKSHKVWTNGTGAKAIDAWSPVNAKYNSFKK